MTIFLPLVYLMTGWLLGKTAWDFKSAASWILTRIAIPIVIIFNLSTRFDSMSTIIVATAISMIALLVVGRYEQVKECGDDCKRKCRTLCLG
ncbi:hypothetical protein [Pantoea rodasii]|uniref:hypothetical protein n=1 Tax=Pantoea rodasii TaxID=1076549 RepID=UPI00197EB493|nr:hypothetical protein [Pantoea rodasii]